MGGLNYATSCKLSAAVRTEENNNKTSEEVETLSIALSSLVFNHVISHLEMPSSLQNNNYERLSPRFIQCSLTLLLHSN